LFSLLSLTCCCGVPAYYAWPAARQYPATADMPDTIADLTLRDDAAAQRAVDRLTEALPTADGAFAGVYGDRNGKRITVAGVTGLRLDPAGDLDAELATLTSVYRLRDVRKFDLAESGAHERCGVGRASGATVAVCAWADHGSLAIVLLTRRSVTDSAELTGRIRSAVLTRG
jgi:hypothetical protein